MVRFILAGLAMLALPSGAAAHEDNGPALVDLFVNTCKLQPTLPSELERIASDLGFVSDGGPVPAEIESGPEIDYMYLAKLMMRGEKVGLSAYFDGPADAPTVTCSLSTVGVSAEGLPDLVEKSLETRDRSETAATDGNLRRWNWHVGPAGSDDTLEMSVHPDPPRRASVQIVYHGHRR